MAEIAARGDGVADGLLEFLDIGEAAGGGARPEHRLAGADFEDAAGAGDERKLADVAGECCEKLLGHPGGAEHPAALGAVFDFDAGGSDHGGPHSGL